MFEIVSKLSTSFVVASFIPALAFVTVASIIFDPIIPPALVNHTKVFQGVLEGGFFPTLILAVVIGFTLSSLNTSIYKTYEGYMLLHRFPFLQRKHQKQAAALERKITVVDKELKRLQKRQSGMEEGTKNYARVDQRIAGLMDERYRLAAQYDLTYPRAPKLILPTRFGNALRAAESYSSYRYSIDGVPMWPRLIHVMPDKYYAKLEQNNNGLAFLLNCSVLLAIVACLCILASLYQFGLAHLKHSGGTFPLYFIDANLGESIYLQRAFLYLALSPLSLVMARIFYSAAIPAVIRYGNLIRSSYDLFRFNLLTALHRGLPSTPAEESDTWKDISEFIAVGNRFGTLDCEYVTSPQGDDDRLPSSQTDAHQ